MRLLRRSAAAALVAVLAPAVLLLPAAADQGQGAARQRVDDAYAALQDSNGAVRAAGAALAAVAAQLPDARASAEAARVQLASARASAAVAAAAALQAQLAAQSAQGQVDAASAQVAAEKQSVAALARRTYQQGPLADMRTVLTSGSPQELVDRTTLLREVFRSQDDSLHQLSVDRLALARTEHDLALRLQQREQARQAADARAGSARDASATADRTAARVASLVAQRQAALASAQQARAGDQREYDQAQAASVALAARIRAAARAAAAAEAARRAAAARQADAAAAAARAAAAAPVRAPAPAVAAPAPPVPDPQVQPAPSGFLWPANGPLTSPFGWRMHPIFHVMRFHAGIDIGAGYGAPVYAAQDGVVTYAGDASGYGTLIVISHGTVNGVNLSTAYGHQSALLVSVGQHVTRGEQVGAVGNEGNSTGPHLHFEVRLDGSPVDPLGYVSPP